VVGVRVRVAQLAHGRGDLLALCRQQGRGALVLILVRLQLVLELLLLAREGGREALLLLLQLRRALQVRVPLYHRGCGPLQVGVRGQA
jgi:hypothetical protein